MWSELARQLDGQWNEARFFSHSAVRVEVDSWTITLDSYSLPGGQNQMDPHFTRLRAPYVNPGEFRFSVRHKTLSSAIAKAFGAQDITVGDAAFDDAFVVKANDEQTARNLLVPDLRAQFLAHPALSIEVKDDEGWFGARFPKGSMSFTS